MRGRQQHSKDTAGAKVVPEQRKCGRFVQRHYDDDTDDTPEPLRKDPASLKAGSVAGGTIGVTAGVGELYGALAPRTGRGGGLEKRACSTNPDDFHHVPGYGGHRPDTWSAHYNRRHFGIHPEGADSKGESHIATWRRPPLPSGAAFEGNTRLKEGPPHLNPQGLFKQEIEEEIEKVGREQLKMCGDTCYASLRKDRKDLTKSGSARTIVDGSAKKLDTTLNRDPDGYSCGYADYNNLALFQGFYPPSRHLPGYAGHVPGGRRT
eukprot:TRINITY_DN20318_c1_g1_i1.p1 TRINITY_DN20318_c1_g1~~TRINITY_DN20318_c1_g1_i1.p1  ORF type:complete len:291 (+),score=91.42 TRINITY_DN20318_c1_g1_i1:82-873(+)